ncbi:hypothetical protein [Jeotgalibacillus campisalis]|uniref:Uncharacterized protein n=1 Tax=Jeotgalibacillus campisalis TaxID=220754 RepID=A0A0C2SGN3_9BACL|nr:hypothetical protein [Jeotgalibacillus campisalis]KIL53084.1 hypothetical protein KR50_04130 [Jeotgalibacillus campisalis]
MIIIAINVRQCPSCEAKTTIPILYGDLTPSAFQRVKEGLIKHGGSTAPQTAYHFYCKSCGHEWTKEQAIDSAYEKIRGIKTSVGGFRQGFYNIEICFDTNKVTWSSTACGEVEEFEKTFRETDSRKVLEMLKPINLLNWRAKYNMDVLDGTSWFVEVVRTGRNITKSGHNLFPAEWEEFCEAMRKVSGKEFGGAAD